jgi:AraC-like DNA-binding protein
VYFYDTLIVKPHFLKLDDLPVTQIYNLIGHLQDILFFFKNRDGILIGGNQQFAEHCGFHTEKEIIGKNDHSIFPKRMADKFHVDDRYVMDTEQPMLNIVELFPDTAGKPEWYSTNKFPLRDQLGKIVGVCGTVQNLQRTHEYLRPFIELEAAANHIREHYAEKLYIKNLARMSHLSVRQFQRRFTQTYQVSARKFQVQTRIVEACRLLRENSLSISEIALEVGFYDHSTLARHFLDFMGESASLYRKRTSR